MHKPKILIVEDEKDLRELVAYGLTSVGYTVYQAGDGVEAFRIAKEVELDLIILNVVIPEMNGKQLLRDLRKECFGKKIPVIVTTAQKAMKEYFEAVCVEAFFKKPFELSDLVKKVEEIIGEGVIDIEKQSTGSTGSEVSGVSAETEEYSVSPGEKKKILIFEFNRIVYQQLEDKLARRGFLVELVSSKDKCIKAVTRLPDIILIRARKGSPLAGYFAEELKENPALEKTPIVIYSDIGKNISTGQGNKEEVNFVWSKEGTELLKRVLELLGQ